MFKYIGAFQTTTSLFPAPSVVSLIQMPQVPSPQSPLVPFVKRFSNGYVGALCNPSTQDTEAWQWGKHCCNVKVSLWNLVLKIQPSKQQPKGQPLRMCWMFHVWVPDQHLKGDSHSICQYPCWIFTPLRRWICQPQWLHFSNLKKKSIDFFFTCYKTFL